MPGRHLNDNERDLLKMWESPKGKVPLLSGISIKGEPGLRGIKNLDLEFNYPVTVVCGKNGSGKTTVLTLAALAFHPPEGHYSYQARNQFRKGSDRAYYTFSDFFFKGPQDPDISGVEIEWRFKNWRLPKKSITKQTEKWMKYPTRPTRPVHYVGASRIIPAIELSVLRSYFNSALYRKKSKDNLNLLNDFYKKLLAHVLGRDYSDAGQVIDGKYSLRICNYNSSYTGFNMGAGEDTLIDLLHLLQQTPNGSLVVIEEIELGLHPLALKRLAQGLITVAKQKQLQIITSSHSYEFIDSLPGLSRILLEATPGSHEVTYNCTTRYALGHISGDSLPELMVYCEDSFTEKLINFLIKGPIRERIKLISVGDKAAVARQYVSHIKGKLPSKCLAVFDGEVTHKEACNWIGDLLECRRSGYPCNVCNFIILPGKERPEKWVLTKIIEDDKYINPLARLLNYEGYEEKLKGYLYDVKTTINHHNIGFELSKKINLDKDDIEKFLVNVIRGDEDLLCVKYAIERALEGEVLPVI